MLGSGDFAVAREIAAWKRKVSRSWEKVQVLEVHQVDMSRSSIKTGEAFRTEVLLDIDGLSPEDIGVEAVVARQITDGNVNIIGTVEFKVEEVDGSRVKYVMLPETYDSGTYDVSLRIFAKNPKLPHRMDFALVKWI